MTLLLVADISRMKGAEKDPAAAAVDLGGRRLHQPDIYLFCASEGLATGVRRFGGSSRARESAGTEGAPDHPACSIRWTTRRFHPG